MGLCVRDKQAESHVSKHPGQVRNMMSLSNLVFCLRQNLNQRDLMIQRETKFMITRIWGKIFMHTLYICIYLCKICYLESFAIHHWKTATQWDRSLKTAWMCRQQEIDAILGRSKRQFFIYSWHAVCVIESITALSGTTEIDTSASYFTKIIIMNFPLLSEV